MSECNISLWFLINFLNVKKKTLALYSKLIHYKVQIKCTFDIKLPFGLDLIYFGIEKNVKNFFVGNLIHICGLNMLYIHHFQCISLNDEEISVSFCRKTSIKFSVMHLSSNQMN